MSGPDSGPPYGARGERSVPIAVVGIAALMPGARDAAQYWRNIVAGRDLITDVPPGHWLAEGFYDPDPETPDTTYCRRGAFLPEIEFDPLAHGLPPATLPAVDPAQLLGLTVADALLADLDRNLAGPLSRERVSVILGSSTLSRVGTMDARIQRPVWLKALREQGIAEEEARAICDRIAAQYVPWQEATFPGLLSNVVAGRIANRLDLHGTNCTVDAACASSLAAVSAAANELALGKADLVVTGGVDATNNPLMYVCFSKTPALSPTGDVRPFSEDADGTMLGEGLGMLGLKRLDAAERDGDRVYAVIRGIGSSSDGRGGAIYAPMPQGQVRALRRAYEAAGYGPGTVELVEAHGTATRAGDAAEFESLRQVFGEAGRRDAPWCALGTVKSQIGHTKAAAGAAGLIKAVLALHHRVLPPTIKVRRPNPGLGLDASPFYLNTAARPWTRGPDHERRASVSSFGFGGANFHVAVEEYRRRGEDAAAPRFRAAASEPVLFGADSARQLSARLRDVAAGVVLADLARESQHEFDPDRSARLAVVASDEGDLSAKLHQATAMLDRRPDAPFSLPGGVFYDCGRADPGRVAFVFPGQGSQYVGMGADVAMAFPPAQDAWDLAAGLDLGERGLHETVFPPPAFTDEQRAAQERRLTDTLWAQPALAAHSLSLLALLTAVGVEPACVAGHSLGELVALHAAGAMDAESLLRLARRRGELLARIDAEPGAMLAISADEGSVASALGRAGTAEVWLANINSPRQTVVSGTARAIEALQARLSDAGIAARRLAVSAAFHSPMARSAVAPLREFLDTLKVAAPQIDVYGNADARVYSREPDAIRDRLAEHPAAPVRFRDQVEAMYSAGVRTFVEVGAGSALTGLIGQILGDRRHAAVSLDKRGRDGVTAWHEALGRLAVRGVPMNLAGLAQGWISAPPGPAAVVDRPRMSVRVDGTGYRPPQPAPSPAPPPAAPPNPDPLMTAPPTMEPAPAMSELEFGEPAPQAPIAAVPADAGAGWLAAVQEMQRQTAEAHMHFQRVLGEAHQTFLQMAENTFTAFAAPGAVSRGAPTQGTAIARTALAPTPALTPALPPAAYVPPPAAPPTPPTPQPSQPPVPVLMPQAPEPRPVPRRVAEPEPTAPAEPVSLDLLLSVVADKTGYPADMLNGGMDLETDLGIDSIKKVEIFAAVRQRAEGLPDTDSPQMSRLFQARTLDEVVRLAADGDGPAPTQQAADDAPAAPPTVIVRRLQVRPIAAPACGLALAGIGSGALSVVDGGSGLAPLVVARLAARGITATADETPAPDAHGVILLGGVAPVADPQQAESVHRAAFEVARSVAARMEERGGVFVTVQDTGGCFGLTDPDPARAWLGGLAALARTAAREWPQAAVKAIDCQRAGRDADAVAAAIVGELLTGGSTLDVGLRADGTRWTLADVEAAAVPAAGDSVTADSVLVVSGGARGVTAAALLALAEARRPRMLLLGRTDLTDSQSTDEPAFLAAAKDEPSLTRLLAEHERAEGGTPSTPPQLAARARTLLARREVRATLAALGQAGAKARYACVDVTDRDALERELARTRRAWGPITGLIHGAGVIADKRIADKTDEQFDRVFGTKVAGLRTLLEATAADPLELLCVFSSVAARYGNPGQCDYAMANEVLNQVAAAERLRRPSCRVRVLGWGPWEAGMVTAAHAAHFGSLGVPLIPLDAGARAFVDEVGADDGVVQVLLTAAGEGATSFAPDCSRFAVEAAVDARSHGYLADHAPAGVPVLPLAMAMEWFAAAGRSHRPDRPTALADIWVLSKAELPGLAAGGHRFAVEGRADDRDPDVFELRLTSAAGAAHCRARLVAPSAAPQLWTAPIAVPEASREIPAGEAVYAESALFHGPGFHALRRVEGMSPEGAEAQVIGVRALGWPDGPCWTDPAAIDGALQAAVLWARHVTGDATLPMGVDALRVHRAGPAPGALRCLVRAAASAADQTRCDLVLLDEDGEARAELFGVSLIRRPDMASAHAAAAVSAQPAPA